MAVPFAEVGTDARAAGATAVDASVEDLHRPFDDQAPIDSFDDHYTPVDEDRATDDDLVTTSQIPASAVREASPCRARGRGKLTPAAS